jgi:hypothetical protein
MPFHPFVYGLVDPAEPKHVRYVGMATVRAGRPLDHAKAARRSTEKTYTFNWIRKIQAEGREPAVLILEELAEGASQEFVGFIESCYISSLKEIGHKLTNIASGGVNGKYVGEEGRARNTRVSASLKGRLRTQEHCDNLSKAIKAIQTPELRAQNSALRTGHRATEATKVKMRASIKDAWEKKVAEGWSPTSEHRAKIGESLATSDAFKTVMQDPTYLAKLSEAHKGKKHTDETRAKISAALKGRTFTPEWRAKLSAANVARALRTKKATDA